MGAKTSLLGFSDGDLKDVLTQTGSCAAPDAEALVRQVFPDHVVTPLGDTWSLWEAVYPPEDVTYALVVPGGAVVCDQRIAEWLPSELPEHVLGMTGHRRVVMHAMHSVVDWACFAVWEDGVLQRSLSVAPDDGVLEDLGERLPFEEPYWSGVHPVEAMFPDQGPYPLPFHPLELGEEALRALVGFVVEGMPGPGDLDAEVVQLHGFRVTDPSGAEQAARERMAAEARASFGEPRIFARDEKGDLVEVGWDGLDDVMTSGRPPGPLARFARAVSRVVGRNRGRGPTS